MPILFDAERRLWALRGGGSTYAFGVDGEGSVQHLYHGPPLARIEDVPSPAPLTPSRSFEPPGGPGVRYEYPAWGGMFYGEPCLKATFPDGVRDVRLVFDGHSTDGTVLEVSLRDPRYPLRVRLLYRLFEGSGLVERRSVVENVGEEPMVLEAALSAAWHPPRAGGFRLTHLAGRWLSETLVFREALTPGKKVLESRRGITSHHANPFFAVDRGDATEGSGEVWFGALAWSGNWRISADLDANGLLCVSGGVNDFDFAWHLEPGGSFETPAFLGGYTGGGFGAMSRLLHRHARDHVLPKGPNGEPAGPRPVLYNSWEATYFDVSEEGQGRLAEKAASLGVELFVVDDGWFGERDDDTRSLGDWTPNPRKFPGGLGPLVERVEALGMSFGLWVEPEMVNPDSDLYRAHPEWVYNFPTRPPTESRDQLVLNLARSDVREHLFGVLDRLLSENGISYLKWDMNRPFSEPGWPEAPPERQREVWVRHVWGVYEVLDRLREAHPGVAFESCSGGGGRVDLGILRRTDQAWTSDNTDAFDRLRIQEGFSMAYPARAMTCWVADPAIWNRGRRPSLSYRFHSAMMGTLGIGGNLLEWSDGELEEAARLVARYKEVRNLVGDGDQHRLLSPRESDTTAVQYVSPDRSESVVFALRNPHRFGEPPGPIRPRGLKEDALYRIAETGERRSGASLMGRGVELALEGDLSSAMLVLREERP